jgi:hypothetical protein
MMQIYKTNFPTEKKGKDYLLNLGVLIEVDGQIVFLKNTAAVVNIGKVVDPTKTTDPENPVYYDGWAYDIMSSDILDFGTYEVYPAENAAHSFMGWAKDAEVPK